MIDREKTIQTFVANSDKLTGLPLVTDDEMLRAFGDEVMVALERLADYDRQEKLCQRCEKRCCQVAQCELYDSQFNRCPIFDLRPVVCRLHFCNLFQIENNRIVEELSNIFFDCAQAGESAGHFSARLFDSPPLGRCAPSLVEATAKWMQAVRECKMPAEEVQKLIHLEAEKYLKNP